jgi:exopolysaccharide biosynthesis WecB/TagA/CpsF family protein
MGEIVAEIQRRELSVAVVGMGVPKQEQLAIKLHELCPELAIYTCGGFISQMSKAGGFCYYPEWINKYGLRSFYRIYREGGRMIRRYTVEYKEFYGRALVLLLRARQ